MENRTTEVTKNNGRTEGKTRMAQVITYQLAYVSGEVTLCRACAESDDHECGALGPVAHGEHRGECDGARHPSTKRIVEVTIETREEGQRYRLATNSEK